ncbi:hypothetical protein [Streptomyces brasiliensis]|uniref:Uncharacterized protein n=1 Tax=Streptomyces brasiliensis TaxID=1954 RepID=A0A917UPU2_9ACTN|nr:hypothetical protein [Streptomyces brasiliensis]GGJ73517.1 hypothetical protein GCM10010121_100080 [Streptomyces brasiliensis]
MLVRVIDVPADDWSFATAREPARFGVCEVNGAPGVEHAVGARGTLCSISARHTTRYLHLFDPGAPHSCLRCRQRAEAAPTEPSAQERLHDRVRAAAQGKVRDDLLAALRGGAKVSLWINGPSASLAEHYAGLDELTDGAGPTVEAFGAAATVDLARVESGPWRFIVVLPADGGGPFVARGPRDPH